MEIRKSKINQKYTRYMDVDPLNGDFSGCTFEGITFPAEARFSGYFRRCVFRKCTFYGSYISGKFYGGELIKCKFESSTFNKAFFSNVCFRDLEIKDCFGYSASRFDSNCRFLEWLRGVKAVLNDGRTEYELTYTNFDNYGHRSSTTRGGSASYSPAFNTANRTSPTKNKSAYNKAPHEKTGSPPVSLPEVQHYRTPQPEIKWRKKYRYPAWQGWHGIGDTDSEYDVDKVEYEPEFDMDYGYGKSIVIECNNIEILKKFC